MSSSITSVSWLSELKSFIFQQWPPNCMKHLKTAHARAFASGLHQNTTLLTLLLHQTLKFPKTHHHAVLLFHQFPVPPTGILLCNYLLSSLVHNNSFLDAIKIYHSLHHTHGFHPDHFTFPSLLKACSRPSSLLLLPLGFSLHSFSIRSGLDRHLHTATALCSFYSKSGLLLSARKVFDEMPERNAVSWTAIISSYIDSGVFDESLSLFERFLKTGIEPDGFSFVQGLTSCSATADLRRGRWLHSCVTGRGMGADMFVGTALVDMYSKCGDMRNAQRVFGRMDHRDVVSWGTMIHANSLNGFPKDVLDLFFEMQREGVKPDHHCITAALSSCSIFGALRLGDSLRRMVDETELLSNRVLGTAVIEMYTRCGDIVSGWRVFRGVRGDKDLVMMNVVISGLVLNGCVGHAFAVFGQVERLGFTPNGNTFVGLLSGCTHSGLVEEGRRYFGAMSRVFDLYPTVEHYGCMVDLFSKAGLIDEAFEVIETMDVEANAIVWGTLLAGCRLHRNVEMARHAAKKMAELSDSSGNYVLLSNIYNSSRQWRHGEEIRERMNEEGVKKVPGISWIEVDGVVHEFLAGDRSHPSTSRIYDKLEQVMIEVREMGHVPPTEFVLFDVEEEEKEHDLVYHSEKLAIAFGLISTPSGEVIRIVKNLRVCGDCHMVLKLITKIAGRRIVVRDNNRFHYFSDGSCSCGDYW